jgi:hypothetical protein
MPDDFTGVNVPILNRPAAGAAWMRSFSTRIGLSPDRYFGVTIPQQSHSWEFPRRLTFATRPPAFAAL